MTAHAASTINSLARPPPGGPSLLRPAKRTCLSSEDEGDLLDDDRVPTKAKDAAPPNAAARPFKRLVRGVDSEPSMHRPARLSARRLERGPVRSRPPGAVLLSSSSNDDDDEAEAEVMVDEGVDEQPAERPDGRPHALASTDPTAAAADTASNWPVGEVERGASAQLQAGGMTGLAGGGGDAISADADADGAKLEALKRELLDVETAIPAARRASDWLQFREVRCPHLPSACHQG